MEETIYDRTNMLLGQEAVEQLKEKRILLFGVGGVGSFAAEALARTGVGVIGLADFDRVSLTNINRQLPALHSTVGRLKTEVLEERIRDINPSIQVLTYPIRLTAETLDAFALDQWDCVLDAIDDVPAKLLLIGETAVRGLPFLSSMGTGNKLDPSLLQITDIRKTHTCPLARALRREAEKMGVRDLKVLFSPEPPHRTEGSGRTPASAIFVPASAGLMMASWAVRELLSL